VRVHFNFSICVNDVRSEISRPTELAESLAFGSQLSDIMMIGLRIELMGDCLALLRVFPLASSPKHDILMSGANSTMRHRRQQSVITQWVTINKEHVVTAVRDCGFAMGLKIQTAGCLILFDAKRQVRSEFG